MSGRVLGREVAVLRPDGHVDKWLHDVWPPTGAPLRGTVMNGGWYWRRDGDVETAYYSAEDRDAQRNAVRTWLCLDFRWIGLRYLPSTDDTIAF